MVAFIVLNVVITTIGGIFVCSDWAGLYFSRYVPIEATSISIALIVVNLLAQILAILGVLGKANKTMLAAVQVMMLVTVTLTLASAWIGFCGAESIVADVGVFFTEMEKNNNHEYFERLISCCGWEVVQARCVVSSNRTCYDATLKLVDEVGRRCGNWAIGMLAVQMGELLFVFMVTVCFTGFDWIRFVRGETAKGGSNVYR